MSIHIFTRDLRIKDNSALNAISEFDIYPIFIFSPDQVEDNKYKSESAIQFMVESLVDLNTSLNNCLGLFYGDFEKVVNSLANSGITKISITKDYTPYAIKRENKLKKICKAYNIEPIITADYCLNEPAKVYKKYTPYKLQHTIPRVAKTNRLKILKIKGNISFSKTNSMYKFNDTNILGGRTSGMKKLNSLKTSISKYGKTRNTPSIQSTELGPYIKFGCISIREVYWALRRSNELISQLIWRDFFIQLGYNFPVLKEPLKEKYSKIKWENNKTYFRAWKNGETGFPIIDAGMRQLNETGFMHNRLRLITASFLVKTLLIDWKLGEHYFATKLRDYDPLVNNGNWQWIAGSGADSQPYFRIFNPWLQSKTHDPECKYIKYWIPELKDIEPRHIHNWYKCHTNVYLSPIVDHETQKIKVLAAYKKIYT